MSKIQRKWARPAIIAAAAAGLVLGGVAAGVAASSGQPSLAPASQERSEIRGQGSVDRAKARAIAVRTIERRTGSAAKATGIGREDDWGARWEVEVTSRGREFDVYVARSGAVVKVKSKGRSGPTSAPVSGSAPITRTDAAAAAQRYIAQEFGQSARVTWTGREDDLGAKWEIEVTTSDGREFDVYVGANGKIVAVR